MASSQVEIASSSPFGCVLRDHNRRDGFRASKWRKLAAFVSVNPDENENSWPLQIAGNGFSPATIVNEMEALAPPDCSGEAPNLGAASLVQIWEKRLNRSIEEERDSGHELETEASVLDEERFESLSDLNSEKSLPPSEQASPCRSRSSDAGESERVRVADIIKRLSSNDGEQLSPTAASDVVEPVISLRIRGRQAIADLLMQMERERHGELGSLGERKPVSKFPHKGRIQSMLRLRSLERGLAVQERHRLHLSPASTATVSYLAERLSQSCFSITHLRERFSTKSEQAVTSQNRDDYNPKSPRSNMNSITKAEKSENCSTSNKNEQTQDHEVIPIPPQSTVKLPDEVLHEDKSLVLQETRLVDRNFVSREAVKASEAATCSKLGGRNLDPQETSLADRIFVSREAVNAFKASTCFQFEKRNLASQETSSMDRNFVSQQAVNASEAATCSTSKDRNLDPQETSLEANASEATACSKFEDRNLGPQETSSAGRNFVLLEEVKASEETACSKFGDRNLGPQETSSAGRNFVLLEEVKASEETACSKFGDRNLGPQESSLADSQAEVNASETTACSEFSEHDIAEELDDSYMQYYEEESGYDWISEISRPRSYWEDRRQEWYYEMLNSNSKNGEIRQLLERGTVSGFLASEFRERMDSLMTSRLEIQTQSIDSQGGEEEDERSRLILLMQNSKEKRQQTESNEEIKCEEEEEEEHEEEQQGEREDGSLINSRVHEASDYFDQSTSSLQVPSPTLLRTWSFRDGEEADDDSEQATSSSRREENLPSQSYYENDRECSSSSVNHPSIEMELICELRGHMEQLYHEMSDLRKSLKSCMDMQMILMQQSMKPEFHSAESKAKNKSHHRRAAPKKGNCCICYETKIDSLLYRCGHMCTCLKCAHELQWSSGKCPICCAPIVDVVRAHLDS